jgi:hypothetical protein
LCQGLIITNHHLGRFNQHQEFGMTQHTSMQDRLIAINDANRVFSTAQNVEFQRRLTDPLLLQHAMEDVVGEQMRRVPVGNQTTLEVAIERAERLAIAVRAQHAPSQVREALSQQGSRGGSAARTDPLRDLIIQIVREEQSINWKGVFRQLEARVREGVILAITDEDIVYRGLRGKEGRAALSGLKDRVSRAKAALRRHNN